MAFSWTVFLILFVTLVSFQCQAQTCTQTGWYGDNCQYKCRCTNDNCDPNGYCYTWSTCVKGWFGSQCLYADLTSTMADNSTPSWLSDGDDSTCNPDSTATSVTVTLTSATPFNYIWIHSDTSLFDSTGEVKAVVRTEFKRSPGGSAYYCIHRKNVRINDKTQEIQCDPSSEYQELTLYLDSGSWGSLCSVYITADPSQTCPTGKYGSPCRLDCGPGCDSHGCYKYTGQCTCKLEGFTGNSCLDCISGRYGDNCDQVCSPGCFYDECYQDTGNCVYATCKYGFTGYNCQTCYSGQYGPDCSLPCPENCKTPECHHVDGNCTNGCQDGFSGTHCTSKLPGDSSANIAVGVGIGVGVTVLVVIIIAAVVVYFYRRRSSRAARTQRPPGDDETAMDGQDEHPYNEMYTSEDGYDLPTDAPSTLVSEDTKVETNPHTAKYANADANPYDEVTERRSMDGTEGDAGSTDEITTTIVSAEQSGNGGYARVIEGE